MATVIDIIKLALKDINVIGSSETPSADVASDCLATLNQMIGQWQVQKLYVYAQKVISVPMTGAQTYTIGSGGDINVPLPAQIDSAEWRLTGVDYPLDVLQSIQEFETIGVKVQQGNPWCIFFQRDVPLGTIYIWPQPAGGELRLVTRQQLTQYTALTTEMVVPDEYVLAIRYSLAELIAPMFGLAAPNNIIALGRNARRVMKRNNTEILPLFMPVEVNYDYRYNINSDV